MATWDDTLGEIVKGETDTNPVSRIVCPKCQNTIIGTLGEHKENDAIHFKCIFCGAWFEIQFVPVTTLMWKVKE